jgi:hypothetical protein
VPSLVKGCSCPYRAGLKRILGGFLLGKGQLFNGLAFYSVDPSFSYR